MTCFMKALQDLRNRLLKSKPKRLKNDINRNDIDARRVLTRYFSKDDDDFLFI
ncbi:hypothetical protein GCM10022292_16600 [Winogradskyella damuponensis]|uniref:Uncharacterized protein n=1 Tax=Winogradskyella damuponensis TaxID=943939 RepID=A0ABP8CT72_9FLAO